MSVRSQPIPATGHTHRFDTLDPPDAVTQPPNAPPTFSMFHRLMIRVSNLWSMINFTPNRLDKGRTEFDILGSSPSLLGRPRRMVLSTEGARVMPSQLDASNQRVARLYFPRAVLTVGALDAPTISHQRVTAIVSIISAPQIPGDLTPLLTVTNNHYPQTLAAQQQLEQDIFGESSGDPSDSENDDSQKRKRAQGSRSSRRRARRQAQRGRSRTRQGGARDHTASDSSSAMPLQ